MITGVEIGLVAGFLEGEGHFTSNSSKGSCRIVASSTDRDVIEKIALIMGATISGPYPPNIGTKEKWVLQVATSAPEWMMTLYPLLGHRRRAQIQKALARWRASSFRRSQKALWQKQLF